MGIIFSLDFEHSLEMKSSAVKRESSRTSWRCPYTFIHIGVTERVMNLKLVSSRKMDCHPGNKHRPCQIRVGRIVSTKDDLLFLGSMSKYQRINAKIHELMPINEGVSARRIGNVDVGQEP